MHLCLLYFLQSCFFRHILCREITVSHLNKHQLNRGLIHRGVVSIWMQNLPPLCSYKRVNSKTITKNWFIWKLQIDKKFSMSPNIQNTGNKHQMPPVREWHRSQGQLHSIQAAFSYVLVGQSAMTFWYFWYSEYQRLTILAHCTKGELWDLESIFCVSAFMETA